VLAAVSGAEADIAELTKAHARATWTQAAARMQTVDVARNNPLVTSMWCELVMRQKIVTEVNVRCKCEWWWNFVGVSPSRVHHHRTTLHTNK